ncbi:zinc-ribbon domain-containing protein [Candidatus Hydrogenosomobacter endosymbioticus]|uniref:Zinc finger/thioredoxin putative domain-containing protein n=1 Tax=Candidatus Hydrogenosomobacter endosymbioticus TaxID=2558174 RepID=A0ABN6L2Z8_9PROT|nr:zinc-ribbon domain-containing protein [Candidatus Hydrogenosomobacter endosymbioticus]BDB96254.1 hypothetical protein HYD_3870 [Candidatus Hydrogenosomobacter endosymbioticus]
MIVRCASCAKRYHIDEDVIGSKGRYVRCTSCGHVWKQDPPLPTKNSLVALGKVPMVIDEEKQTGRKKNSEGVFFNIAVSAFAASLFFLSAFMMRNKLVELFPSMVDLYALLEIPVVYSDKRVIEIKYFSTQINKNSNTILIVGDLFNSSRKKEALPPLLISFIKEEKGEKIVLRQVRYVPERQTLLPEETFHFEIPIQSPPQGFSYASISI